MFEQIPLILAGLFIFFAIVVILNVLRRWFVIIPPRVLAIKETLGKFDRVLYPGFHLIMWPFSSLRTIRWTYFGQNGQRRVVGGTHIPFQNTQMDIPPIKGYTKNYIDAAVDGTVMYHVSDPQKAVYHTDDVLNMFYQCIVQETKNVITQHTSADLQQKPPNVFGEMIMDAVKERFPSKDTGISIGQFIIQEITVDDQLRKENQKIASQARQHEILIEQEKSKAELLSVQTKIKHDREIEQAERQSEQTVLKAKIAYEAKLKEIEFKRKLQEEQDASEKAKQAARLEREQLQLQAELDAQIKKAEAEAKRRELELQSDGFTPEQRIELERIRGLNALAAKETVTKVYAPSAEWIPREMIGLAVEPSKKRQK